MNTDVAENNNRDICEVNPEKQNFGMLTTRDYYEHYLHNSFEDFTKDLITRYTPDGALFIDIGAHHGYYSQLVASKNKRSKILAYEPVPGNCRIIKQSIERYKYSNIVLNQMAISDKNEKRLFNSSVITSRSSFYKHPEADTKDTIEVDTRTLDDVIQPVKNVPVVIKIDVEGHEISVLTGMKKFIEETVDLRLFIEFNPGCIKASGHEPEDLPLKLNQMGLDIFYLDDLNRCFYKVEPTKITDWKKYFIQDNIHRTYFNLMCVKKQKSLSVMFFSHSSQLAGAERSLLELTRQLIVDHNILCNVVLPDDGPLKEKLEEVGASTIVINYSWWCEGNLPDKDVIASKMNNSALNIFKNIALLQKINPDVILTNTIVIPWGAIAAYYLNKQHIWFIREFGELDLQFKFFLPFQNILDIVKDSSDLIIVNSIAVKNSLFKDTPSENIDIIYPPVDISWTSRNINEESRYRRPKATRLIIFGTIAEHKGQKEAILAVQKLVQKKYDVELCIMGPADPEYLKQLKEFVITERLNEFINFLGFQENPYAIVKQTDIVLVCSRYEAFGRITLESMLLYKPVVATNRGGIPELIHEGYNGLLYEPGNISALADKIEYLIQNKEKIKEFGENGYKFASENFAKETSGGKLADLIRNVLKTKPRIASSFNRFASETCTLAVIDMMNQYRYKALEPGIKEKESQIRQLNSLVLSKEAQIQQMQSGIAMNLQRRCQNALEKLFKTGTRRRYYCDLAIKGIKVLLNEGWRSLWEKLKQRRKSGKLIKIKIRPTKLKDLPEYEENNNKALDVKVSIIIPTKNAGQDFGYTLEKIRNQKGIREIEIIIVDSGSIDRTIEISKKHNAKIFSIRPDEFNHGLTRNYGAEKGSGDYYLFMVQDAIPIGDHWLYNMAAILERDEKIAAATCRQVPRSDADLYASASLWNHYRGLEFYEDRIAWPDPKFDELQPIQKRMLAGFEDVCGMIRSDVFNELKFSNTNFAEDLDLGVRLLKAGNGIAYLYSNGIIHSHNRSPSYSLKRNYVDSKYLPAILNYKPGNDLSDESIISLLSYIATLYAALCKSIYYLDFDLKPGEIIPRLKTLLKLTQSMSLSEYRELIGQTNELNNLLNTLINNTGEIEIKSNVTIEKRYFDLLGNFEDAIQNYPSLKDKKDEFIAALYHYLAVLCGSVLGNNYVYKEYHSQIDDKLSAVDKILSEGV